MHLPFTCRPARFMARPNRYVVHAVLGDGADAGAPIIAHCADPGRLAELLVPGATVHVSPAPPASARPPRKTTWDLRFVEHPASGRLVSLDTRVPNALFAEGLASGFFADFSSLCEIRREVPLPRLPAALPATACTPHSRADFRLTHTDGSVTWVEVKSASLVLDGIAHFPDAVTARGRRHLLELAALARAGVRTAVVFIIQRPDASALIAHRPTDPAFADALDAAHAAGVILRAATCRVSTSAIELDRMVPVLASAAPAAV